MPSGVLEVHWLAVESTDLVTVGGVLLVEESGAPVFATFGLAVGHGIGVRLPAEDFLRVLHAVHPVLVRHALPLGYVYR
jgi:hypothetical protein